LPIPVENQHVAESTCSVAAGGQRILPRIFSIARFQMPRLRTEVCPSRKREFPRPPAWARNKNCPRTRIQHPLMPPSLNDLRISQLYWPTDEIPPPYQTVHELGENFFFAAPLRRFSHSIQLVSSVLSGRLHEAHPARHQFVISLRQVRSRKLIVLRQVNAPVVFQRQRRFIQDPSSKCTERRGLLVYRTAELSFSFSV